MGLGLTSDELLTTTRSVRRRLDFGRRVDRSTVLECIEIAVQAPNGSNRQGWHWVVVEASAPKEAIAEVYRSNFAALMQHATEHPVGQPHGAHVDRNIASGAYLAERLGEAPMLLVPCINGRHDGEPASIAASTWGSLLPAVWSFMLALRARGLGSAWTTAHLARGGEQAVASILGIPFDDVTQGGLFPIAYTTGTSFRRAERRPTDEVVHWDRW